MERGTDLTYPRQTGEHSWVIEVKGRDGKDEELYIELPPDALSQMGWHEGDTIEWIDRKDGSWELKKVINEQD